MEMTFDLKTLCRLSALTSDDTTDIFAALFALYDYAAVNLR